MTFFLYLFRQHLFQNQAILPSNQGSSPPNHFPAKLGGLPILLSIS